MLFDAVGPKEIRDAHHACCGSEAGTGKPPS